MAAFNLTGESINGITFVESSSIFRINWLVTNLTKYFNKDILDQACQHELLIRNTQLHKDVRKRITSDKGFGTYTALKRDTHTDLRVNTTDGKVIADQIRYRSFYEVSIAPLIYLSAIFIFSDSLARLELSNVVTNVTCVPKLYLEFAKKIRISVCGKFSITPKIDEESYMEVLDLWGLSGEKSYFLPSKLRTKQGIFDLLVQWEMFNKICPDYFTTVPSIEFAKIPFNAND